LFQDETIALNDLFENVGLIQILPQYHTGIRLQIEQFSEPMCQEVGTGVPEPEKITRKNTIQVLPEHHTATALKVEQVVEPKSVYGCWNPKK